MIFFDTTKTGSARHRSGLTRVSSRLRAELGEAAVGAAWDPTDRRLRIAGGHRPGRDDWFLTSELFSEAERSGFTPFLESRPMRLAAIFHDAIPLKHPHFTWPQSVARHPGYMKLLARFDRIWAVSRASREELLGFWKWQGLERVPPVEVLALGADFAAIPRVTTRPLPAAARLLCIGILEPRKNQTLLLETCEELWTEGLEFELDVVGRINPHFGKPVAARLKALQRRRRAALRFHPAANDDTVRRLYASARASVFPTLAEGCGLPLLESLWLGVPCVCSDLPVLRENADGGGCLLVAPNDPAAWQAALRTLLTGDALTARLSAEATVRTLPTWRGAASTIATALRSSR
jgi:glycosyltransferase involved in cell wall biosynthesis